MTAFEVPWSNVHSPETPESPLVPSLEVFFVRANGKTIRRRFLVDSGADMSMAPRRLCQYLDLDWDAGEPMLLHGISPKPECLVESRIFDVDIFIREIDCTLTLRMCFASGNVPLLLGRDGLFDWFSLTFDKRRLLTRFELQEEPLDNPLI